MVTEKSMPILFLSIEGVLSTLRSSLAYGDVSGGFTHPDPVACMLVKKICDETHAKIVIIGQTRLLYNRDATVVVLNVACSGLGNHILNHKTYWRTRDDVRGSSRFVASTDRGREIHAWITEVPYEVGNVAILDDALTIDPYKDFYVRCEPFNGIGWKEFHNAESLLLTCEATAML